MIASLKIKGNKYANAGVGADLVAIGDPRFIVLDQVYDTSGIMSDFVILRHYADKSVYTMMSKNVTPFESSRDGSLYVSVAIPKGEHIPAIYNLLYELSQAYKGYYMTNDGSYFHFTNAQEQPEIFQAILQRYPTVPYPYRPVTSAADENFIATLYLTPQEIGDILADPMRPEFANFGQIVFVPVSNPDAYISSLKIPSRILRSYKIVVNGRPNLQPVSDLTVPVTVSVAETPTTEGASLQFSIEAARSGQLEGVTVDDLNQTVTVRLQGKKKPVAPTPPPAPKPGRRKPAWLPYVIGAGVALIIAGGAAYFLGLFDKEDAEEEPVAIEVIETINPEGGSLGDTEGSITAEKTDGDTDNEDSDGENDSETDKLSTPKTGHDNDPRTGGNASSQNNSHGANPQAGTAPQHAPVQLPQELKAKLDACIRTIDSPSVKKSDIDNAKNLVQELKNGGHNQEADRLSAQIRIIERASSLMKSFDKSKEDAVSAYTQSLRSSERSCRNNGLPELAKYLNGAYDKADSGKAEIISRRAQNLPTSKLFPSLP